MFLRITLSFALIFATCFPSASLAESEDGSDVPVQSIHYQFVVQLILANVMTSNEFIEGVSLRDVLEPDTIATFESRYSRTTELLQGMSDVSISTGEILDLPIILISYYVPDFIIIEGLQQDIGPPIFDGSSISGQVGAACSSNCGGIRDE